MTWLGDPNAALPEAEVAKLKAKREVLVGKIQVLQQITVFKTDAAKRFHQEDLTKLAKDIGTIDRKLGRT